MEIEDRSEYEEKSKNNTECLQNWWNSEREGVFGYFEKTNSKITFSRRWRLVRRRQWSMPSKKIHQRMVCKKWNRPFRRLVRTRLPYKSHWKYLGWCWTYHQPKSSKMPHEDYSCMVPCYAIGGQLVWQMTESCDSVKRLSYQILIIMTI